MENDNVEIRHNTKPLEEALDHIVRRASLPTVEAEAAARDKEYRASAFRRLATGAAIAIAALGIGIGIYLATRDSTQLKTAEIFKPDATTKPGTGAVQLPPPATPRPTVITPQPELDRPPGSDGDNNLAEKGENKPPDSFITTDFTIFRYKDFQYQRETWSIHAGHLFQTEADQATGQWEKAWCYTSKANNGVKVQLELGIRAKPTSTPEVELLSEHALNQLGLTQLDLLVLSSECPWLDGRKFNVPEISRPDALSKAEMTLQGSTLNVRGPIGKGFLERLKAFHFSDLVIESEGGLVDEAIAAGRWLRDGQKNVKVSNLCLSSCVFVLAGGFDRKAEQNAHIGVHRFSKLGPATKSDIEDAQAISAEIVKYFRQMGISPELWEVMAKVPNSTIKYLDHKQLSDWKLLNNATIVVGEPFDFEHDEPPETEPQQVPLPPNPFVRREGLDIIGGDMLEAPIRNVSIEECEERCHTDWRCQAITYNTQARACFLKNKITGLFKEKIAVSSIKIQHSSDIQISILKPLEGIELSGDVSHYSAGKPYSDCVLKCEDNQQCRGFSYQRSTNRCRLFSRVTLEQQQSGVVSGKK